MIHDLNTDSDLRNPKEVHWYSLVGGGVAAVLGLAIAFYRWGLHGIPYPFEDAAMLFRYAEILAQGGGIAFNNGDSPAASDGATDLGFVLALAPLIGLGLKPATAGFLLNAAGVAGLGVCFAWINYRFWCFPAWLWATTVFGLVLTVASPIAGGFSSVILGAGLAAVFGVMMTLLRAGKSSRYRFLPWAGLGALAGLAGWWRPDGFALGLFAAFAALWVHLSVSSRNSGVIPWVGLTIAGSTYVVLGLAWIVFRLAYFGQLVPTSGVNKISVIDWEMFPRALTFYVVSMAWLWLLFTFFTLASGRLIRAAQLMVLFAAISTVWLPFSLTFNWWGRIYWPALPVLTLSALSLMAGHIKFEWPSRLLSKYLGTAMLGVVAGFLLVSITPEPYGRYFAAPFQTKVFETLRDLDSTGTRVATTEAGLIPLAVDEGKALDTYVHNTRSIALFGDAALREELREFEPNLIVVHGPTPIAGQPGAACEGGFGEAWTQQALTLYEYAAANDFRVLNSFESGPCDSWTTFGSSTVPKQVGTALEAMTNPWP